MSAIMERFSTNRALTEGISVSVGAVLGYFLGKYLPTSGLIRALIGFVIVVLGAGFDGVVGDAVMGFGIVILVQGVTKVSLKVGA
jgi:F0F1-type ATP synthase assembly protein I